MISERQLAAVLWGTLALLCVLVVTVLVDENFGEFVDSAIYLLTAQSLSAGEGYNYLGRPFFVRPPGLSWLLAPLTPQGDGTWDHRTINLVIQAFAAGAFLALALCLRRLHGPVVAPLLALLFALNRVSLELLNKVFGEFPFLCLFFAGLALLLPARDGRQAPLGRALVGAVLVGLSLYFRSVGLLVLPALVLADLWRPRSAPPGRRWQGALLAAVALAVHLPWMIWSGEAAARAERPSTQLLMFDYSSALLRTDPGDPDSPYVDLAGWQERLASNAQEIVNTVGKITIGRQGGWAPRVLTGLLAAAVLFAWWRRRSALDWYALASVALLLSYFTYAGRLFLPLIPLLLSAVAFALESAAAAVAHRHERRRLVVTAGAVLALLLGGSSLALAGESLAPTQLKASNAVLDGLVADWLRENTPPDTLVLHERGAILAVLSGRTTYTDRNLRGAFPEAYPDVDWIVLGPLEDPAEPAIAAAARERKRIRVPGTQPPVTLRLYRMRDR
ncbi:MAG: hypothetical protein ACT4PU_08900 [Planctomycetota bacterium]